MSKPIVPRAGAPIADMIDDSTRAQLEGLRDRLGKQETKTALERPRDATGRFREIPRDQLIRDNRTLQRMRDVTAAAGDRTVGWLLDQAQVPSVTQLTKRYPTQASRAPLLGLLAGQHLGPVESAVLGTTPRLGTGGALVVWEPKPLVPVSPAQDDGVIEGEFEVVQDSSSLEAPRAEGADSTNRNQRADGAGTSERPSWWSSLKDFGRTVMQSAKSAWKKLKTHPLVASVLSFFVGKGFGPAHGSMHGANPPSKPTRGAPLTLEMLGAPEAQLGLAGPPPVKALEAPPVVAQLQGPDAVPLLEAPSAPAEVEAAAIDPTADFAGAVTALGEAWPAGAAEATAAFTKQAEALQSFKLDRLGALGASPEPSEVTSFLAQCDAMHGKADHSRNVSRLAELFARDPEVLTTLRGADDFSPRLLSQVRAAAPWLNLGDVEASVGVLAAKRKMTGEEFATHVKPRAERAAGLFEKLRLGGGKTAQLIATARDGGVDRPLESQLVRLLDDSAALGAKPFCRSGGFVNVEVFAQKLEENAARGAYHPELANVMIDAASRGLLDDALTTARDDDLYVR